MGSILRTPLCDRLGIEVPIISAGMGRIASPRLVAAVSNAGGLGVLGATTSSPQEIREAVRQVRELTDKPFGVDVILPGELSSASRTAGELRGKLPQAHVDFVRRLQDEFGVSEADVARLRDEQDGLPALGTAGAAQLEAILDERVPVFVSGLGSPGFVVKDAHAQNMTVMAVVGSVKQAQRVVDDGVDVVIAQGYDGGAHTGHIGTFSLLPQVVDAVQPTPTVAAGGIGDGRGIAAALAFGCQGVWIGTRFLATEESDARPVHKDAVVQADDQATRLTNAYTGKRNRRINSKFVQAWEDGPLDPLPMPLQPILVNPLVKAAPDNPEIDRGAAGQIAGLIREVKPAAEVFRDMVGEAEDVLHSFASLVAAERA